MIGPGSGSVAGGIVLLVYLAAIRLCMAARAALRSRTDRRAWMGIALVLAVLGIEKAVHVEALLLNGLDRVALAGGWYATRRGVQIAAIEALATGSILLAAAILWLLRRARTATHIGAAAAILLVAFVSIRAVSLHQIDRLLGSGFGPVRVSNIVELVALCVIAGAARSIRRAHLRGG